jgi:hypothetical protein
MQKKVSQEINRTKLVAQVAMGVGDGNKSWSRSISAMWNEYVRSMYNLESEFQDTEENMRKEYAKMSHLRPKMIIQPDKSLRVVGIPK